MARFKKGDRVKRIKGGDNGGMRVGDVGTVTYCDIEEIKFQEYEADILNIGKFAPGYYELISSPQYTKLSPKVGEKYRAVKDFWGRHKNEIVTIAKFRDDGSGYVELDDGFCIRGVADFLTTEYLELVSEPTIKNTAYSSLATAIQNGSIRLGVDFGHETEPINQSIIKKTMNFIKKSLLSKDDKNLIKAGFMDDNMNLTGRGREALEFITFTENKAKLVEMAEAQIAEDKEDKE